MPRLSANTVNSSEDRPTRVLQVVTAMNVGGLQTFIMNVYRNIDKNLLQFDFLYHREGHFTYDDEIVSMGGTIYHVPRANPLNPNYHQALNTFFRNHTYDAVHSHINCMSALPLKAACKSGVPVRIAHSHSSSEIKDFKYPLKMVSRRSIPTYATQLLACGEEAGKWLYGDRDFRVINNGINTRDFTFSQETREDVRTSLGISPTELVVLHVGRFISVKNQSKIIDIFWSLQEARPDSRLILVGDGPMFRDIQNKVTSLGLDSKVLLLGLRSDVARLECAADAFLMPSLYEGLPLALVEAQTSGLPCIVSTAVPSDCDITDLVTHMGLEEDDRRWADTVVSRARLPRTDRSKEIIKAGFDSKDVINVLQSLYMGKS